MSKLYGVSASPYVRKVFVVLEEKGIAFDLDPVSPFNPTDEFLAISPLKKIPAYKDEYISLADSSVISFYLERRHPEPSLYPSGTEALAKALWFEEYGDGGFVQALGTVFVNKLLKPRFLNQPCDDAAVKDALENRLPPMFEYLEKELSGREWLADNRFTIADITIAAGVPNFRYAGYDLDGAKYPKLTAYVNRILARPSFQKALAADTAFFEKVKKAA